jgi:serine/threonine protein kinase
VGFFDARPSQFSRRANIFDIGRPRPMLSRSAFPAELAAMKSGTITNRHPAAVGRYDLLERIGKGGMGAVYRARARDSGAIVAVKILKADLSKNPKLFDRFIQEFRAAAKLDHPNIVRVLDLDRDGDDVFMAMEFVEGEGFGRHIMARGRLPESYAVRVITQVAQALDYAHRNRVVHRDVKPDNIMVRPDGFAKLADFGLAKDIDDDNDLTRTNRALGTPHFMAPEQYADAKNAGVGCDVYSLAATLYSAVTGAVPFADCASLIALARKVKGDIPSPRELVPELSASLDSAIGRAMSPDPKARPASCLEFARLLPAPAAGTLGRPTPLPSSLVARPERRAAVRHLVTRGTTCVIDTGLVAGGEDAVEAWPAIVRDLSVGGIGLVLARRFEPGTAFAVRLDGVDRELVVQVKRVQPDAVGHWSHGCEFESPLDDFELWRSRCAR